MQMQLKRTGEAAYFAASNSRHGFYSYYEHCFRGRVGQLWCIKGGPGTGKSTLMREIVREGERRGYRTETYYCSSDADSLDGVLLFGERESFGLLDATAPHPFEPCMPGVSEEIIDLGQFWNADTLARERETITALNQRKSEAYRFCYRCLAGVGEISDALREAVTSCIDVAKLDRTAARLLRSVGKGEQGHTEIRLRDSIGLRGRVRLDTYLRDAERLCLIEDHHDSAYALTERLWSSVRERHPGVRVSYHPVLPDRIDALFLPDSRTAFIVCESCETETLTDLYPYARRISMQRLLRREALRSAREELRRLDRLRQTLTAEACAQMTKAADAHFLLERIYAAAMDFDAKERFTALLCRRLFGE